MEPVAIIGVGCRFPGADNVQSFWQLLRNGADAIAEIPLDRWDVDAFYDPVPGTPGKMSTRWGGFLEQVDQFDPGFFGISPREVERMDPQQRLVLEVAWEAIENAGIAPEALSGSQTGVFMGIGNYDYCRLLTQDLSRVNAYDGTGNTLCIAANRLSYTLNLRGPSVVVETACSSSLVAVHFACQSLQLGESDCALVGGASLMLSPEPFITYSHARMMAADGRCKTFDARADGYVRGEGCGVIVLKRLSDALRDQDNVLAVIRGTAVNQDGLSNGLTAPNGPSQQAVIRQALSNAGVSPAQISYVEAHGTGTSLGDPIEVKSLKAVLMQGREPDQICWLGSVKTNIGHLEAAAGIASIIKVVLAMQHRQIPPHLHLQALNPYIGLSGTPFAIPTQLQPWLVGADGLDCRFAGVSAFGFGGTNCHVVLAEAPAPAPHPDSITGSVTGVGERSYHLLALSAKTEAALLELSQRYSRFLAANPQLSLAEVCFTANTGRSHFDQRLAVVAASTSQLRAQLAAFSHGFDSGLATGAITGKKRPKVAFLFTGQGAQYVGMGRQLYETQPVFRQTLEHCQAILAPCLEQPLLDVLYESPSPLNETAYTQPALFALEYALAQLWKSWGIEPAIVMGHSVGEYVAACIAGVFSLEDGLKLIAERGRLMQALPPDGAMVAVFASQQVVQAVIETHAHELAIAAFNGPKSVVISGRRPAVAQAIAAFEASGIQTKALQVSHAFHSPLMEPMLADFQRIASTIHYAPPRIKLISNVTGEIATDAITTPAYWCRHVREPVRFAQGLQTLHQKGYQLFLEVGPKPILSGMGRYCLAADAATWLPSLSPGQEDWQQLLQSLAALYVRGAAVKWSNLDPGQSYRRLQLPTYPFQRQRYWAKLPETGNPSANQARPATALTSTLDLLNQGDTQRLADQLAATGALSTAELNCLPKLLDLLVKQHQQQLTTASTQATLEDWLYEIQWQPKPRHDTAPPAENGFDQPGVWLILADRGGVGERLADYLRDGRRPAGGHRQHRCILVYPGAAAESTGAETKWINPSQPEDFEQLWQEVLAEDLPLRGVIHLWSLEAASADQLLVPALEQVQTLGLASTLHLLQALKRQAAGPGLSSNGHRPDTQTSSPQLWFVTQGAVPIGSTPLAVAQAPLWGLGKVVALEHPELWGGLLDLPPVLAEDTIPQLFAEIADSQGEDQLAFREGQRYAARLVRKQQPDASQVTFKPEATHLITGGLGALGLKVAEWMVAQGARNLVLIGRRGAPAAAQERLRQLKQAGAQVLVLQADVSHPQEISQALAAIAASMPPLQGVFHAAGVLDDGILLQQDWDRFKRVLAPKVQGAWNLHQFTQDLPLDFFVVFSSAAALLGSPGQGNYAAANAFLDALAHYRRSLGLAGLSINWGPWGEVGMASDSRRQAHLAARGLQPLTPDQGLQAFGQLLGQSFAQVAVLPVTWPAFRRQFSAEQRLPLLANLVDVVPSQTDTAPTSAAQPQLLQQLQTAADGERLVLLRAYLHQKVAQVLGLSTSQLDIHQPLQDLGLDSLMAVELTSVIRTELQLDLPIRALIEDPSIVSLAAQLVEQLSTAGTKARHVESALDLSAEAVLDPAIDPSNAAIAPVANPAAIFLTGATGFLGAFLLQELLEQTPADIYCLVRAADPEAAKARLQTNLQTYGLWQPQFGCRIIPVLGDLSQPRLGLSTEAFDAMASQMDAIYHNGALLNYVYPYAKFKPINVLGTQEVLRLACQTKLKPVHHISSVAVFESSAYYGQRVTEADPIDRSEGIYLGYSQSKWVSERLVKIAGDRGLPITLYRPPLVSGCSQTGVWNTEGFLCRMIKGCIQMGSIMADLDLMLDLSPVDYNSRAIVYLSRQPESLGQAFHLQNPHLLPWRQLVDFICGLGYPMEQVSYQDWQIRLSQARDNPLYPLLPFFGHQWADGLTYLELNQQARRPQISCEATQAALAQAAVVCPPLDAQLLNTYFSYFIESGFLEAPTSSLAAKG